MSLNEVLSVKCFGQTLKYKLKSINSESVFGGKENELTLRFKT